MTRSWLAVASIALLAQNAASQVTSAQSSAAPPSRMPPAGVQPHVLPDTQLKARIFTNDGRLIVTRAMSERLAWLADSAHAGRDSTVFDVSVKNGRLLVRDWTGHCLTPASRESRVPLTFGDCDRDPLFIQGEPSEAPLPQREFGLRSSMGAVGPTGNSPLLFPRSRAPITYHLQPVSHRPSRLP